MKNHLLVALLCMLTITPLAAETLLLEGEIAGLLMNSQTGTLTAGIAGTRDPLLGDWPLNGAGPRFLMRIGEDLFATDTTGGLAAQPLRLLSADLFQRKVLRQAWGYGETQILFLQFTLTPMPLNEEGIRIEAHLSNVFPDQRLTGLTMLFPMPTSLGNARYTTSLGPVPQGGGVFRQPSGPTFVRVAFPENPEHSLYFELGGFSTWMDELALGDLGELTRHPERPTLPGKADGPRGMVVSWTPLPVAAGNDRVIRLVATVEGNDVASTEEVYLPRWLTRTAVRGIWPSPMPTAVVTPCRITLAAKADEPISAPKGTVQRQVFAVPVTEDALRFTLNCDGDQREIVVPVVSSDSTYPPATPDRWDAQRKNLLLRTPGLGFIPGHLLTIEGKEVEALPSQTICGNVVLEWNLTPWTGSGKEISPDLAKILNTLARRVYGFHSEGQPISSVFLSAVPGDSTGTAGAYGDSLSAALRPLMRRAFGPTLPPRIVNALPAGKEVHAWVILRNFVRE